jgi:hypothetical protein
VATNGRAHVDDKVDVTWNASHELDQQNTFARAGVDRDMGGWRLGLDATRVAGRAYGETKAGITAEVRVSDRASLSARAGAVRNDDGEQGGYLGLGLALDWN